MPTHLSPHQLAAKRPNVSRYHRPGREQEQPELDRAGAPAKDEASAVVIPDWGSRAVIPTVRDVPTEQQGLPENSSPYEAALIHLVERFATTPERVRMLQGLMDWRNELQVGGITDGSQWINGSFVEHVEIGPRPDKEARPYYIDVISFYHPANGESPELKASFEPNLTWNSYYIDAYVVVLGSKRTTDTVNPTSTGTACGQRDEATTC